jgi:glycosyltransferase involved in cell wall biosynthesis
MASLGGERVPQSNRGGRASAGIGPVSSGIRRLRIGFVAPYFPPQIGGANIYCYELAKAIAGKGHDVHVFAHQEALADPAYTLHPILTLDLVRDLERLEDFHMDVWHSLFLFYAPLALRKSNVFVTGFGDDFYSYRIRRPLRGRALAGKYLLWRLGDSARTKAERWLQRKELAMNRRLYSRAIRRARHVVTISNFSKMRLCEAFPDASSKTTVIPPGVTSRFFCNGRVPKQPNFFLTVTRLDETDRIKNVHGVIHALAELKDGYDFRYRVVAGAVTGGYRKELEQLIVDKGLSDKVSIEGRKTDEELADYYARADLFILASYAEKENFEGFGIVFLEANAAGTPVLTTREGGMVDYVSEGVNGFFAESPSPAGLETALKRYLDGDIKFDSEQVRLAPEPYRWPSIAERMLGVYAAHGDAGLAGA